MPHSNMKKCHRARMGGTTTSYRFRSSPREGEERGIIIGSFSTITASEGRVATKTSFTARPDQEERATINDGENRDPEDSETLCAQI